MEEYCYDNMEAFLNEFLNSYQGRNFQWIKTCLQYNQKRSNQSPCPRADFCVRGVVTYASHIKILLKDTQQWTKHTAIDIRQNKSEHL